MPLDGHDFLVAQGWSGKGNGLRQGSITRPIAIPQKKNLAGLGKDRDEAFPFWDHLFSAASMSIKLNLASDVESDEETSPLPEIKRTSTGILSNRRPLTGTSATTSGSSTPDASDGMPRLSLVAIAKRDAARANLYARFFRGPILGPDNVLPAPRIEPPPSEKKDDQTSQQTVIINDKETSDEVAQSSTKKRKRDSEDVDVRTRRKKDRKEQKAKEKEERRARRRERQANQECAGEVASEGSREKEKKRRKRESREKEKSKDETGADRDQVTKEKRTKKKLRKGVTTAADHSRRAKTSEGGQCASIDILADTLEPAVSEPIPTTQQPKSEVREHKKKKRKREEA